MGKVPDTQGTSVQIPSIYVSSKVGWYAFVMPVLEAVTGRSCGLQWQTILAKIGS